MSIRPVDDPTSPSAAPNAVFHEIASHKAAIEAVTSEESASLMINVQGDLDHLNEVERSAANLGVTAEEWKPIGFLNKSHYGTLLKSNALDSKLAQRLEAFKAVSSPDSAPAIGA
jgi:hypothetical protein